MNNIENASLVNKEFPRVIAVTLNWNGREDTIKCVKSLLELDYPDPEIVIVDNASTDDSVNSFRNIFPNVTIIENEKNLGYALGYNRGIEYALKKNAKYIFILNNDTIIDRSALKELVKTAESDHEIGFVSGKVYHYSEPNMFQVVGKEVNFITGFSKNIGSNEVDKGQYDEIKDYKFLDDVFWLVRSDVFRKIGMYDSNFFLQFEETDLCARANKHYRLVYTPRAKIWHKGSKSGGGSRNPKHTYYLARNRIVFMRRNGNPSQFLAFMLQYILIRTPMTVVAHLARGRNNSALAHVRGIFSGMKWALEAGEI